MDTHRTTRTEHEGVTVKVLIATNEFQGTAIGDYAYTVEGELVTPLVAECSNGDACGCSRGFPGLASAVATTTAMVVDRPGVTEADLRDAVHDYLDRGGWIELFEEAAQVADDRDGVETFLGDFHDVDEMIAAIVDEHVEAIIEICDAVPVGAVVQRCGDLVSIRSLRQAA
jgi:hypothetical protein